MIEYRGWLSIHTHWSEEEECKRNSYAIGLQALAKVDELRTATGMKIYADRLNGDFGVLFHGAGNHVSWLPEVLELVDWLAVHACGSYGIIQYWDDEDDGRAHLDQYRYICLRKGKIVRGVEDLLSPKSQKLYLDWDKA